MPANNERLGKGNSGVPPSNGVGTFAVRDDAGYGVEIEASPVELGELFAAGPEMDPAAGRRYPGPERGPRPTGGPKP